MSPLSGTSLIVIARICYFRSQSRTSIEPVCSERRCAGSCKRRERFIDSPSADGSISMRPSPKLEKLAIVHAPVYHFEAQCVVAALRKLVVDPCVGRHLNAPVTAGPIFRGGKKPSADTKPAVLPGNIPAFQIAHRTRRITAIGVRAQIDFSKADQRAIRGLGDEID